MSPRSVTQCPEFAVPEIKVVSRAHIQVVAKRQSRLGAKRKSETGKILFASVFIACA